MKSLKSGLGALGAVMSLTLAGTAHSAEGWYQDKVKWIYPQPNGGFVIAFVNSPAACTSTATPKYFHVNAGAYGVTSDGVKAMLATALMAFAADKLVNVAYEMSSPYCDVNRLYISD